MRPSQRRIHAAIAGLALFGAVSCTKPDGTSDDLTHDLVAASSSNDIALSPAAGRTEVISAVERAPNAVAPAPSRKAPITRAAPKAADLAPVAAPAPTPQPTPAPAPEPAPKADKGPEGPVKMGGRPSARPMPQSDGQGKSEGEVIRDAPVPNHAVILAELIG